MITMRSNGVGETTQHRSIYIRVIIFITASHKQDEHVMIVLFEFFHNKLSIISLNLMTKIVVKGILSKDLFSWRPVCHPLYYGAKRHSNILWSQM